MNKIKYKQSKYKLLAIILTLVFAFCMVSACTLVDTSGSGGSAGGDLTLEGDYLVGMMLYVDKFDESAGEYISFPTDNLDSEDAIYMYEKKYYEGTMLVNTLACQGSFFDSKINITNNGTEPNGKVEIGATFYYTYELMGGALRIDPVYQTGAYSYYSGGGGSGQMLNEFSGSTLSQEETMTASKTNIDGTKEEISYTGRISLSIKLTDYLTGARIIEFDKDNRIIKTTAIALTEEDFYYTASETCEYVILEKDFEVMHEPTFGKKAKGDKYTERILINKQTLKTSETLPVPEGNGFVRALYVSFEFFQED